MWLPMTWPKAGLQEMGKNYEVVLYPASSHVLIEMTFPYRFSEGFQEKVAAWIISIDKNRLLNGD